MLYSSISMLIMSALSDAQFSLNEAKELISKAGIFEKEAERQINFAKFIAAKTIEPHLCISSEELAELKEKFTSICK